MAPPATLRHRLEIQGYSRESDETLARTQLWLRMSPALCATMAGVGAALASPPPPILWRLRRSRRTTGSLLGSRWPQPGAAYNLVRMAHIERAQPAA